MSLAALADGVLTKYEPVIGLEVHVQLGTNTKIFCSCPVEFAAPPNTNVCPVCLVLLVPLPVLSRQAVELAIAAFHELSKRQVSQLLGERRQVGEGDIIHIPANTPHQLLIENGKPFTYFVVKVTGQ